MALASSLRGVLQPRLTQHSIVSPVSLSNARVGHRSRGSACCSQPWQPAGCGNRGASFTAAAAAAATSSSSDDETSTSGRRTLQEQQPWQPVVLELLEDAGQLIRLTLKGRISDSMPYKQAVVRPILLKGQRHLQVSHFTAKQDITKNFTLEDARPYLSDLLQLPWNSATAATLQQNLRVQISKRGKVLLHRSKPPSTTDSTDSNSSSSQAGPIQLSHNRRKVQPIDGTQPDAFLQKIGLQMEDGRIKASMQAKFTQINEFIKLLIHTEELQHLLPASSQQQQQQQQQQGNDVNDSHHNTTSTAAPTDGSRQRSSSSSRTATAGAGGGKQAIHILDCGCGSAHLTFGTYHYLHHVRGWPVVLSGVDSNAALMDRSNRHCEELGMREAAFYTSPIKDFAPVLPPDIVLALHACDTATDEALALGVRQGAAIIAAAPCCHQDLHQQLQGWSAGGAAAGAGALGPLFKDGIVRQRFVDLLTDTFRALLLRICGYRTDVVEFVSPEHTARNILIRAVRKQRCAAGSHRPGTPQLVSAGGTPCGAQQAKAVAEYVALKEMWGVVPHLEVLLQDLLPPAAIERLS